MVLALSVSVALALLVQVGAPREVRLLNRPLPERHLADVLNARLAPGGQRAVYVERASGDLFSVPLDGSAAPIRLNSRRLGREVVPVFRLDPAGGGVLYRAKRALDTGGGAVVDRALDLFWAPLDGSAEATPLSFRFQEGCLDDYQRTPAGTHVVSRRLQSFPGPAALWSSTLDGDLTIIASPGGDVGIPDFQVLPDSTQVVFRADRGPGALHETLQLYRAGVSVRGSAVLISRASGPSGQVEPDYEPSRDGTMVVYRADLGRDGSIELVAAPVSGTGVVRVLSASTVPSGDVHSFVLSPDGARALYIGDQLTPMRELFSARIDQGTPPVRLNAPLSAAGAVLEGLRVDAGARRVVYRVAPVDQVSALHSAPIDGSAPAVLLAGPFAGRDAVADDFQLTGNGLRVVFRADPDGDHSFDLFSVRSSGGAAPVLLGRAVLDFRLGPGFVLFRAEETHGVPELFAARLDGARPAARVHPALAFGQAVLEPYDVSSDGRGAVFIADPNVRGTFELFGVRAAAATPLQLSPDELRDHTARSNVQDFVVAGERALYRAPGELEDVLGLYSVPLDGSAPALALSRPLPAAGGVLTRELTPDGSRVAFVQGGEHVHRALYGAPTDGSQPATRLDTPAHARSDVEPRIRLTPDGASALFVADQELDGTPELFRVALDGSAAPIRLHPPLRAGRAVRASFQLTSDGTRVAYVSDQRSARRFELYVVPLDGSAAPQQLSRNDHGGGDVLQLTLSPDGRFALYLADQDQDEQFELHQVRLDGSLPPLRLNAELVPLGDVSAYALDPTGTWVVYLADQERDGPRELFTVPLDGSAAPRSLVPVAPGVHFDVGSFQITPDGTRVVLLAAAGSTVSVPYVAPIDGSAPALILGLGHSGYLPTLEYRITPDSSQLVYRILDRRFPNPRKGLLSVPLDGSRGTLPLHVPSALSDPFALSPDSHSALYASHAPQSSVLSFYRVPVDGPREASVELFTLTGELTQLEDRGDALVLISGGDLYSY